MKKYIFILMAVVLGITACNDTEEVEKDFDSASVLSVSNPYPFSLPQSNINYSNISNYQGRLKFSNHQDVINTIQDLESQYNLWNDAFNQYYGDLPAEELDSIDQAIQFNDELPAETFESTLNFSSLRNNIEQQMSVWLLDDELDEENDPEDHFVVEDELRTVLNPNSELIVGDTVFKLFEDGYVKIYNENGSLPSAIAVADDIQNGNIDPFDTTSAPVIATGTVILVVVGVAVVGTYVWAWKNGKLNNTTGNIPTPGITNPACEVATLKKKKDKITVGDRRIKWVLKISNYPWGNIAVAKIKGYKQKNNGGWRKYKSDLDVRCYGNMREKDYGNLVSASCTPHPFDRIESEKAKKLKAVGVSSGVTTASKGDVKGDYIGAGGISTTQVLDW